MYIKSLNLTDYRNIRFLHLDLDPEINIIYGENAQGKTNILESIYMCSTGRSHRSSVTDRDIIAFDSKEAHISLNVVSSCNDKIDIHLTYNKKKSISVNGVAVQKLGDLFGIVNTVFFSPQDLHLIQAGPSERRRFADIEICQINNIYYYHLKSYYKLLKQRNNLLKALQTNRKQLDMLDIYDLKLCENGIKLINIRSDFINKLNTFIRDIHLKISSGREELRLEYKPDVKAEDFLLKLTKNREKDIIYGSTSVGIHKDDILFLLNDINAKSFGSQGQQRSACLSVKLGELELIKAEKGSNPVLLLDDVLSELDKNRQKSLIEGIGNIQTIITCTGIEDSIKNLSQNSKIFNIKNGKVL